MFITALLRINMAAVTSFLENEGYELFKKANYLSKVASKDDPDDQPYKSLYEARELLTDLRAKLSDFYDDDSNNKDLLFALASLDLHLGCNFTDTDETSTGEEYLSRVLKSLEELKMEEGAICIYLHALNHLGVLWCARNRHEKAKKYLDQAEELFHEYKKNVGDAPKRADEFFLKPEEDESELLRNRSNKFEATYTHTLYYMAQVMAKLGDSDASAKYCHTTLRRQLDSHDYDATDWALNAATLSQVNVLLICWVLLLCCVRKPPSNERKTAWRFCCTFGLCRVLYSGVMKRKKKLLLVLFSF